MRDLRIEVLDWAQGHSGRHLHDLSSSAIASPDLVSLGLPHLASLPARGLATIAELERAIAARYGAPGGRVLLTAGASEANACVFLSLLSPGDEVLMESPGYQPHRRVPELFGLRVRLFARPLSSRPGLTAAIEAALSHDTRMVVITDLHNPHGLALADKDATALTSLAERRGLWLFCDETFRDCDDRPLATVASLSPRWVVSSTLTKAYGLGGLRIGWIAGSAETLARCHDAKNALSVECSHLSAALALALAPHLDELRDRTVHILRENRALWAAFSARNPTLARDASPRGTTTWIEFPSGARGDAFSEFAGEHYDLALQPGRFFGDPRGARVGLGGEPEPFAAALETLERACAAFLGARAPV